MKYYAFIIFCLLVPFDSMCQDTINRIGEDENRHTTPDSLLCEDLYICRGDTIFALTYYPQRKVCCYDYCDTILLTNEGWTRVDEKNYSYKYCFRKTPRKNKMLNGIVYKPYKILVYDINGKKNLRRFFLLGTSITQHF